MTGLEELKNAYGVIKNEIVVDSIHPEWLRREIAEAVINGNSIKIQISNGNVFDREYYVKLVDRSKQ